ncbi:hypothetical protein G7Y79_00045g080900 [Physcia stellaris]|nr:hypothetical protein G7Y79_00045g080900 [Physcia stellaris]
MLINHRNRVANTSAAAKRSPHITASGTLVLILTLTCALRYFPTPLRVRGTLVRPPPSGVKVATENYDSDDAYANRTPPLVARKVNLKPSPSPEYLTPPPRSPSPEPSGNPKQKGRKRHTQPSQGDAVLVGILGDLNNPDIAARAGEEPLNSASQSETSEVDEDMKDEVEAEETDAGVDLEQMAQNAIDAVGVHGATESRTSSPKGDGPRRVRPPKLHTDLASQVRHSDTQTKIPSRHSKDSTPQTSWEGERSSSVKTEHEISLACPPFSDIGRNGSHSTMISPKLLKHTIAPPEGSPMETLPAIQSSTNPQTAKSPNSNQNLPSIQNLALPIDAPSPKENEARSLVMNSRPTFPMQSPSAGPLTSRSTTFPSPQTRMNGRFTHSYTPTQPSPASTYSEVSPRELYRHSQDITSMSPPGKRERPFYPNGPTPKSDDLTPSTSSADTPLSGDGMSLEGARPVLPPLVNGPYVGGVFKCEHPGCTALPFQTQYLLK